MASMRSTPAVTMSRVMRLPHNCLLPVLASTAMEQRQHTGDEKEDDIHDPKRKARLQHAALFVRREVQGVECRGAQKSEVDLVRLTGLNAGAVLVCDAA